MAVVLVAYLIALDNLTVLCAVWMVILVALATVSVTNVCLGNIKPCSRLGLPEPALPHHLNNSP